MASLVNENLSQILNGKTINEAEGGIFFSDVLQSLPCPKYLSVELTNLGWKLNRMDLGSVF